MHLKKGVIPQVKDTLVYQSNNILKKQQTSSATLY